MSTYYYTCANAGWAQGYAFPAKGTAFSRVGLQGVPTQSNVMDTWNDGSIKHALWTAHITTANNYNLALDPAANGLPSFSPVWPSATVTFSDGATYTASLPAYSVSDSDTWHDGPLAVERAYVVTPTASGSPHPLIQVTFDACGFSDGAYLIWVTITNVRDSAAQRQVTMSGLSITIGGVPVTIYQTTKVIYQGNRYSWSGSGGGYVECIAHPDSEMLIASGLFPRILSSVGNNTYVHSGIQWEPGVLTSEAYFGDMNYSMPSPGGRPELDPVDGCVGEYLVHHGVTQLGHSVAHGIMAGNWCGCQMQADGVTHVTEPDAGPLSSNGMRAYFNPEGPHLIQICILPLVVTTRRLFLRIIQGWASYMATQIINYIPQSTGSYSSDLNYVYEKHVDGMLCNLQAAYGGEPRGYRVMKCWEDAAYMTPSTIGAQTVSSITRSGSVATVTTSSAHGYTSNEWVLIAGAAQTDYDGYFKITVTGSASFTYAVLNAPATPATGTISVTRTPKGYWTQLVQENIDRCDAYGSLNPFHATINPPEFEFDPGGGLGTYGGVHLGYSSMSYWHVSYKCYSLIRAYMMGFSSTLAYLTRAAGSYLAYFNQAPRSQWVYLASWYYKRVCLHSDRGPHTMLDSWAAVYNANHVAPINGYDSTDNGGSPGPPYYQQEYRTLLLMARWLGLPNYEAALLFLEVDYGALNDAPARPGYALAGWDVSPPTPSTRLVVQQPEGTTLVQGSTTSYGSVLTSATSSLTFTVKNLGSLSLTGLGITIDGTSASMFTVTSSPTAPVSGPSGTTTFVVRFAPTSTGTKTATLHLASNDAVSPFNIVLSGTGTVAAPQLVVEQPSGTALASGATRPYGSVTTGQTRSLTFTIRNTGTADLTSVGASLDGTNASLFTITASPTATVTASSSTTCVVRFAPVVAGNYTANLRLVSNDGTTPYFTAVLTGTGTDVTVAHVVVEQPAGSQLVNGEARGLGSVVIGGSIAMSFLVKNLGNATLTGVAATIDGTDAARFAVTTPPTTTVAGMGSTTFTVTFTPTIAGTRTATLHLASSDTTANPFDVVLTASGSASSGSGSGIYGFEFRGTEGIVTTGANHTFNLGETALTTRNGITFQWTRLPTFGCVNRNPASIRPELAGGAVTESQTIGVFAITLPSTGVKNIRCALGDPYYYNFESQRLEIKDNGTLLHAIGPISLAAGHVADANGNDWTVEAWAANQTAKQVTFSTTVCTVELSAGVNYATLPYFEIEDASVLLAPHLTVEQPSGTQLGTGASRDFGALILGNTSSLTFTIRNTGTSSLTSISATVVGADASQFTVTTSPSSTLTTSGSSTCVVRFAPSTAGAKAATLRLASNDASSPFDIALAGAGTAVAVPHLVVEQPAGRQLVTGGVTDFGLVFVGGASSAVVTLRNLGGATLTGIAVSIDGADASLFSVTTAPATSVAPNSATTCTVRCLPTSIGAKTAVLHIVSSDAMASPFIVVLIGTGTLTASTEVFTSRDAGVGAFVLNLDAGPDAFAGVSPVTGLLDAGIDDVR